MSRPLALSLFFALAGCSSAQHPAAPTSPSHNAPVAQSASARQCLRQLGEEGAAFTPLPDKYVSPGCTMLDTVQLQSWPSDHATLVATNLGPVACGVSQAFVTWARFGVDRAAQQILGSPVRSIETMGSYSCRNVAGTERRSGHATATAIDVAGVVLENGRRVTVKSGWNGADPKEREFLRVIQKSACKRFATVLSPDYNAAHHDHLHVEGVPSGSPYCR